MNVPDAKKLALDLAGEMRALAVHNSETERRVVQRYSQAIKSEDAGFVLELAQELLEVHALRWQAYELIAAHAGAFGRLGPAELERLGRGIDSWWAVDSFARTLAGPAWCAGQAPDELFLAWAHSEDHWWRRAALVSTVAWNVRSLGRASVPRQRGGRGDTPRTLAVCRLLAADHADMVAKALSWALRMLAYFDPEAVSAFLAEYDPVLAGRVKREVRHKLATGLKNPRRPAKRAPKPDRPGKTIEPVYLEQIILRFPPARRFSSGFLRLLSRLGRRRGGLFTLESSDTSYYPKISLDFRSPQAGVQVDFILSSGESIPLAVKNTTGAERRSPHTYTPVSLGEAAGRLERTGLSAIRIDHAGCNLPWFAGGAHPAVLELREKLARRCLYHLFPSGEAWDFIIPGAVEEIEGARQAEYARPRRPKFEIVSFEKASTPLLQFDVQLDAGYEQLKALFPKALDDPSLRNLWIYLENPYGVDVCLVANEPDEADWSGYFAATRL